MDEAIGGHCIFAEEKLALPHNMADFKPMWNFVAFWYAENPTDAESTQ